MALIIVSILNGYIAILMAIWWPFLPLAQAYLVMESEHSDKLLEIKIQHHIPYNATPQVAAATPPMMALLLGPRATSML